MTMREVSIALSRIDVRRHNDYAGRAALHGHKMKIKSIGRKSNVVNFSKKESDFAEDYLKNRMYQDKLQQQINKLGNGRR